MPYKLRKLKIDRVDLVDKGANQDSHIMLFKRDTAVEKAHTLKEILDMQDKHEEAQHDKWKIIDAMMNSLKSCCEAESDEERDRIIRESASQFVEMMKPVKEALKETEDVHMSKELEQQLADVTKRLEEAEAELSKRDDKPEGEEDIWKGVPEVVRKRFDEQEAQIAIAKAAAEEERNKRLRQDAIRKAAKYKALPINPDDDADLFIALNSLDEPMQKRLYELLDAGDANLAKSVSTKERGYSSDSDEMLDEEGEITRLIDVEMKDHSLSFGDALSAVAKRHPDLYMKYARGVAKGK